MVDPLQIHCICIVSRPGTDTIQIQSQIQRYNVYGGSKAHTVVQCWCGIKKTETGSLVRFLSYKHVQGFFLTPRRQLSRGRVRAESYRNRQGLGAVRGAGISVHRLEQYPRANIIAVVLLNAQRMSFSISQSIEQRGLSMITISQYVKNSAACRTT